MTLLVRDEEDILESNILFHLSQGVDKILVVDNGSVDGTVGILDKYKRKGVLEYEIINKHTYEQDKWVSGMAMEAVDKYGATHLLHCDADEFWFPYKGNLKDAILGHIEKDVIYVPVINYIPPSNLDIEKLDFKNFEYMVNKTTLVPGYVTDRISSQVLFYTYPNKLITTRKFTSIGYGNDTVNTKENVDSVITDKIYIHHFPIRSYHHFKRKVINGGSSYRKNPVKNPSIGWHWKKWYDIYEKDGLLEEYKKLCLTNNAKELLLDGVIKPCKVPRKITHPKVFYFLSKLRLV